MSDLDRWLEGLGCQHRRFTSMASGANGRKPFVLPGDRPQYAPDRLCQTHHVRLDVSFDIPRKRVVGTVEHTLSPINDGLAYMDFDSIDLKIRSVRLKGGKALKCETLDEKLRVHLDRPRKAGEQLTIAISYEGQPRRGLYFISPDQGYPKKAVQVWSQGEDMDSRYWFPCYDFPNQKATSETLITVPEQFFAVSNGALVEATRDAKAKTKTYHWKMDVPHVTYLIMVAAGEYTEMKDKANGVPLYYYVPKGREEEGPRTLDRTPKMVEFFSKAIGVPYPYNKYAQVFVGDFIFGGMENTTATTLTDTVLHDARAHIDYNADSLIAHELAHQWWGDLLTCRDWSHAWLNEGFATYFEALFAEHHLGDDEFRYEMDEKAATYFGEDEGHYRRPIVTNKFNQPIDLFDRHLYEKGSLVLHMLRYVLGDKLFWKAMRHYCEKHREGVVITQDLQRAIEEATGRSMDWFFEQWVFKGGHPEFKASYSWDEDKKLAQVSLSQAQETSEETPVFQMPLEIAFAVNGSRQVHKVQVKEKEHSFLFPLSEKPKMVSIDPGNWVLKKLDFAPPKEMLLHQLQHDVVMGRVFAARALAKHPTQEVVDALRQAALKDAFWGVQSEAAKSLGKMKSEASLKALLECVNVKHPKARRGVVNALGYFKEEAAADALIAVLEKGDESYFVEAQAARSLGETRSPKAFAALEKALTKESYGEVIRAGAFDGFAELKDEKAIPILKEWIKYGKPQPARAAAISALGKLGEGKPDVVDLLIDLLDDSWLRVRLRAIDALEQFGDAKAIPALARRRDKELDGRVTRRCREAIIAIQQHKGPADEVKKLRDEMEKLGKDNRDLRDRLDRIEATIKTHE